MVCPKERCPNLPVVLRPPIGETLSCAFGTGTFVIALMTVPVIRKHDGSEATVGVDDAPRLPDGARCATGGDETC
jgi:hypothetical protein